MPIKIVELLKQYDKLSTSEILIALGFEPNNFNKRIMVDTAMRRLTKNKIVKFEFGKSNYRNPYTRNRIKFHYLCER